MWLRLSGLILQVSGLGVYTRGVIKPADKASPNQTHEELRVYRAKGSGVYG